MGEKVTITKHLVEGKLNYFRFITKKKAHQVSTKSPRVKGDLRHGQVRRARDKEKFQHKFEVP